MVLLLSARWKDTGRSSWGGSKGNLLRRRQLTAAAPDSWQTCRCTSALICNGTPLHQQGPPDAARGDAVSASPARPPRCTLCGAPGPVSDVESFLLRERCRTELGSWSSRSRLRSPRSQGARPTRKRRRSAQVRSWCSSPMPSSVSYLRPAWRRLNLRDGSPSIPSARSSPCSGPSASRRQRRDRCSGDV